MAFHRAAQCHEPAVRPAVDADARRVDVGLRGHVAGERELVFDLLRSEAPVGRFLELLAPEPGAPAVGADYDVAFVRERILPVERPAVAYRLRAGPRILGQQHGVALRGIEAAGLDDVGIERVAALGREGEELPDGALYDRQLFAEFAAVGQRADGVAFVVADLDPVGGRGVGEGRDVVFHPGARGDGVVAFAGRQAALVLAVEPYAVQVAAQRRGFGREVPDPFAVGADHVGHLPVAFGYLGEQTLADAVKVEVHVARVSLLPYEEAVAVDEGNGLVIHALDVLLRAFVVDRALGAVGLAEDHLEGILAAVEAEKVKPSVGCPADTGNVLVGHAARVDALPCPGRKVADPHFDRRISLPGLGVFERVGLVVEFAVEAHHLHQGHFRFVEAQVGDAAAVGREGIGLRKAELLLVDPVRGAVDDRVPRSVVGDAARALARGIVDIEVVAVGIGDQLAVGRERGVARGFGLAEYGHQTVARGQEIIGRVGMAVDRPGARGDEYLPFVGREGVVRDDEVGRRLGEHLLALPRRGVAVTDDVVAFEDGIVFAVGHRADAADGFVHRAQACDLGIFAPRLYRTCADRCGCEECEKLCLHVGIGFKCPLLRNRSRGVCP